MIQRAGLATARNATRQQDRARRLAERLGLAREIHERVLQRLFGVSLALSAESPLGREALSFHTFQQVMEFFDQLHT